MISKIGSYLQVIAKDPNSTAFIPLAEAYSQLGLIDDALEAAKLGTTMLPQFSPGFAMLGRVLSQKGQIEEALIAYNQALTIDPESHSALVGLARAYLIRGDRDLASKILAEAKRVYPEDETIIDMLNALALPRPWAQIKEAPQVKKTGFSQALAHDKAGEPIPTATLAEIHVKQGLIDKAIKIYSEILSLNPENSAVRARIEQLKKSLVSSDQDSDSQVSHTRSPLTVMQRWLSVIQKRKANV